jgi:hypothetical protein
MGVGLIGLAAAMFLPAKLGRRGVDVSARPSSELRS